MRSARIFLVCTIFLALAFSAACGGGSSSNTLTQTIAPSGGNVASITVNGGPTESYVDAGFTSVTVCVPGTTTCQTIDGVLVDTGSSGLRILSSVLTIPLLQQTSGGNPVVECFPFVSGYTWGPVQTADVEMASEKASAVPIQVLSDTDFTAPTSCTDNGASSDSLESLGANGIVGVGLFTQDCGSYCETVQTSSGSLNLYYECTSTTTCQPIGESLAQQVPNPVSLFATDNNGVIIELPTVSGGEEASVSGSLVFGIGTQSNNSLGSTTVYTANSSGDFTTTYSGTIDSSSFIDSGSNGYFFPSTITTCPTNSGAPGFYCPSGVQNLSATNQGANGASGMVNFSIANAEVLFNSPDFAYGDLGGTYSTGAFDWGLPFFFGRNVYTGLQSSTNPSGYWAF
ncbi:MAG: DUF3443 domain-containing protein [Candidatus Sulfotelmatobacter sp.]